MSTLTITRDITGDEAPTAVTLLTLVRTDTGDAIPSSDWSDAQGDFTVDGTAWSISFTKPAEALTYAYTYRREWADGTHDDGAGTLTDYAAMYVSEKAYTTQASLETDIITDNAEAFAGFVKGTVGYDAAIRQAIDAAESEVDSILSGGPYTVPLTFTNDVVDPILRQHVNSLAAYWLNVKRPMTGQQQPGVSFATQRKNAYEWLRDVWYGDSKISGATRATALANAPIDLRPTINAEGLTIATVPYYPWTYWDSVAGMWRP